MSPEPVPDKGTFNSMYGKLVIWTVLVLLAVVLFLLSGEQRNQFIEPGTLSTAHAGVKDCQSCHVAAKDNVIGWMHSAISGSAQEDSKLCLNCHQLGDSPLLAHSVAAEVLAEKTTAAQQVDNSSTALVSTAHTLGWTPQAGEELQCKSCHQEHSGNDKLITATSANHCQSCHSQSFPSFEDGHPQFSNYPFKASTPIKFDHSSHIGKHFKEDDTQNEAPKNCLSCHVPSDSGSEIQTLNFDNNCASCHSNDIRGVSRASASGFDIITVPGIDISTLKEKNIYVGEWPTGADEELSPFIELLLRGDGNYQSTQEILAKVDLMDLRGASDEQLQAAAAFSWQLKQLLLDIANGGAGFLQQRLEAGLAQTISDDELAALLGTLPKSVIDAANGDWFPNLNAELQAFKNGERYEAPAKTLVTSPAPSRKKASIDVDDIDEDDLFSDDDDGGLWGDEDATDSVELAPAAPSNEDWVKSGGWYRDGLTLYYRPSGHADAFVRHWLDLSAGQAEAAQLFEQLSAEDSPGQCTSCHSLEMHKDTKLETGSVNWWASSSTSKPVSTAAHPLIGHGTQSRGFTKFRHTPHLNMLENDGCQTCHALQTSSGATPEAGSFQSMDKEQCTSCHNEQVENQECLSCHQYHATDLRPVLKPSTL